MVRKGFARLVLQDCLRQRTASNATATASKATATASNATATADNATATASKSTATASTSTATAGNASATATAAPASLQKTQHSKPKTAAQRPQPSVTVQADTTAGSFGGSAAELMSADKGTAAACNPLHRALDELGDSAAANVEDKQLEQAALEASAADFEAKVAPGSLLGLECGNMYAGQHRTARLRHQEGLCV